MKRFIGLFFMLGLLTSAIEPPLPQTETKKQIVLLIGPPGCGKGTQAAPLSQALQIPHISTGDLFREHMSKNTPLGKAAKQYIDQGSLVPDELVLNMLFERTSQSDCKNGFLLDGFPRTIPQAKALSERLKDAHLIAIHLSLSDEAIIERISGRLSCTHCGLVYHKKYAPPKKKLVCDHCEECLIQRTDDQEEVVKKRLQVYHEQTEPLIHYYAAEKRALKEVDSRGEKDQVFTEILKNLNESLCR